MPSNEPKATESVAPHPGWVEHIVEVVIVDTEKILEAVEDFVQEQASAARPPISDEDAAKIVSKIAADNATAGGPLPEPVPQPEVHEATLDVLTPEIPGA